MKKLLLLFGLLAVLGSCKREEVIEVATLECLGGVHSQDTTTISRLTWEGGILVDSFQHNRDRSIIIQDFSGGDGDYTITLWTKCDTGYTKQSSKILHFKEGNPGRVVYFKYDAFKGEKALVYLHSVEK